jgi:UDP-N-acetylglucosamine:LPS N-acetylglucosamine transferase
MKICAGASAGGHMNQLLHLLEYSNAWSHRPAFFVTTLQQLASKFDDKGPVYIIGEYNRHHPLLAIRSLILCLGIAFKERPDLVITTGSMPLAFFCLTAKLFGSKIIWIDSIANIERFSMSGRFVYRFADLFLTQWPELAKRYKKAKYAGAIL